jgi:hypothetical protein
LEQSEKRPIVERATSSATAKLTPVKIGNSRWRKEHLLCKIGSIGRMSAP